MMSLKKMAAVAVVGVSASVASAYDVVVTSGHYDIGFAFEGGEFEAEVHDHEAEVGFEASDVLIVGSGPSFITARPSDSAYDFMGIAAGAPLFVFPQENNEEILPWLGLAIEEVDAAAFVDGLLTIKYTGLVHTPFGGGVGSGQAFYYGVDSLGEPIQIFSNLNDSLVMDRDIVDHIHNNLAFTQPGYYALELAISGDTVADSVVTGTGVFNFMVIPEPATLGVIAGLGLVGLRRRR